MFGLLLDGTYRRGAKGVDPKDHVEIFQYEVTFKKVGCKLRLIMTLKKANSKMRPVLMFFKP